MTLVRSGVGSLPHTDLDDAIAFVAATSDVVYLPQLPRRHESEAMLVQWGEGILGVGADGPRLAFGPNPAIRSEAFGGAAALLNSFSGSRLKTQMTGPITIAAALRAAGHRGPGLTQVVAEELEERIDRHLSWILNEADVGDVVVVIDEPALAALGTDGSQLPDSAQRALATLAGSIDAEVGLHCCADTDWGSIASIGFDWLSWDLRALSTGFHHGLDRIAEALGAGTRVMWGMVPTTPGPLPEASVIVERYGTAVANLVVAGAPFESLHSGAWFTPACGLAGLTESDAEAVTKLLADVVGEVASGW